MSTVSEAEVGRLLQEAEVEHDLFSYSIDGASAWQLLRFPVGVELARAVSGAPGGRRLSGRSELIRAGVADWARYARLPRARILVKTFVSALAELGEDGRYRDVFFDDVLDVVDSHVKLEVPNALRPAGGAGAAHLPPACSTAGVDLGARVLARLRPSREVSELAGHLADLISTAFGVSGFDRDPVERRLLAFRWGKRAYGVMLDRVQPRVALVADTGEFELFAAARDRGIRCVELQHGIFNRNHPDALAATAAAHRERVIAPDALLLFGAYWEDELRAGGFYDRELRVVGSPRVDRFRALRTTRGRRGGRERSVLVTSQGMATADLAGFLAETMSLARASGFACRLDVKLHPIYDDASSREIFELALDRSDVRVLPSEEPPSTFELLTAADVHVSISSACHFEAIGIGVPTIVLPLPGHEDVLPLVEAGHAPLAASPAELLRLLQAAADLPVPADVSARYYRPGALERIAGELGDPSDATSRP